MDDKSSEEKLHAYVIPYDDPEVMTKPWILHAHFIPVVLVYSLCFLFGSIGNALVIWAMQYDRRSRTVTAMFLVSLAVADILLLLSAPLDVASYFVRSAQSGSVSCKMVEFSRMLSAFSTVLNLMAITVERYIVIVHPMQSRQLCTIKNSKMILVIVWTLAVVMASPSLYTWETEPFSYGRYDNNSQLMPDTVVNIQLCNEKEDDKMAIYRLMLLFILPVFVHCCCYGKMIRTLWSSTKNNNLGMHTGGGATQYMYVNSKRDLRNSHQLRSPGISPDAATFSVEQRLNPIAATVFEEKTTGNDQLLEVPPHRQQYRPVDPFQSTDHLITHGNKYRRSRTESLAYLECPKRSKQRNQQALGFVVNWHKKPSNTQYQSNPSLLSSILHNQHTEKRQGNDLKAGRRQVIKMLLAVNFAFLIGWGPAVIFEILRLYGLTPTDNITYIVSYVVKLLPYAHCCFNPIIYGFMSKNFRNSLRKACLIRNICGSDPSAGESLPKLYNSPQLGIDASLEPLTARQRKMSAFS